MKILVLTDGIYPFVIGGMQKHSFYLAKYLVDQGEQVTLVHCVPYGKPLPTHNEVLTAMQLENSIAFETIALHFPKAGILPGHYLKESYLYSKLVYLKLKDRLCDFDFIYAKGFSAWHLLHLKKTIKTIPHIGVKFHGYEMFQKPASFKAWLQNYMLKGPVKWNNKHADFVFSYGFKITEIIRSIGVEEKQIIEIPTGIDASWLCDSIPIPKIRAFVFIGRYERRKGIEELNASLQNLIKSERFQFHFIGPIPNSVKVVHENIIYHGKVMESAKIKSIMEQCQVLVAPSHSEGMPNVIMEGMAQGLAIITTHVGAIEAVVDETNGWFVAPGDSADLTNVLADVIHSDVQLVGQKQKNSRSKISSFLWPNIADRIISAVANRK